MNQQVRFDPASTRRKVPALSRTGATRSWRRNLPLGIVGGGVLMAAAAIGQSISFGFENLSWFSLGTPFALGMAATLLMLRLMQRSLDEQRRELEQEFAERTDDLLQTEKRFAEYGETAKEWFWETDTEDRIVFLSSRIYEASGIRPEEILGRKRESLRAEPLSDAERDMWADYRHRIENRLPYADLRYTSRAKDGKEIVYCSSGKPFYDDDGNFLGYRGTARDATGEVAEERRRRADQDLIYNATAVLSDGFYIFDADDRLMLCNPRFKEIYADVADLLEPGVPYERILRAIAERYIVFASDDERRDWIETTLAAHAESSQEFEEHLVTGEWIRVVKQRMDDGNLVGLCIDITAIKRIEEELAEAQRISKIGSYRQNFRTDTMLSYSDQLAEIYGVSRAEIDSQEDDYMYERVHPDDRERVRATYEQAKLSEVPGPGAVLFEMEYRIVRPDGSLRHILERTEVSKTSSGKTVELIGTLQDITARRRAEQEIEQGQRIAGIGTFRWDVERDVAISCSPEVARIVGRPVEEFMALGDDAYIEQVVHPEDREKVLAGLRESIESGEPYALDYRLMRPDGEIRYVFERAEPVSMRDGKIHEYLCTIQDATASKRFEKELEEAQTVAQVGSFRWNNELNRIESFSREYLRIHGRSEAEMRALGVDGLVDEIIHPDDRDRVREVFDRSATEDESYEIEYRIRRPDGEYRHIVERCDVSARLDGRPTEQLGTLQDVTELRQFEQELENAQRLASIGSFRWDAVNQRLISGSGEYLRILGRASDNLPQNGDSQFEITHPDDRERLREWYRQSAATGEEIEVEYRLLRKDGEVRIVNERLRPHLWRDGVVVEQIGTIQDITERKLVEQELEDAQHLASIGSFRWDLRRGRLVSCSAAYLDIFGCSEEFLMSLRAPQFDQLVHPEDLERLNSAYRHIDTTGEDIEIEYRILRTDGEVRNVVERLQISQQRDGVFLEQIGTLQDITERKQSEQALEEAQRLARTGSYRWDLVRDQMISCTPELLRIFDVTRDQVVNRSLDELQGMDIHPEDREKVMSVYRSCADSREVTEIEYRHVTPQGEIRYLVERLRTAVWRGDTPIEQIGTVQDVTERRQVEQEKRASDDVLEAAIENVPGGFLMLDQQGTIVRFNRRFFDLYPQQKFYVNEGLPYRRFLAHGLERGVYVEAEGDPEVWLDQRPELGPTEQIEFIDRLSDGRSIQIASRLLSNGTRVGIHVDVTELESARLAAERANAAKSDFLASMSHELRTPMHGILSFAELGIKRMETLSQEKLRQYLENIQVSGNRLLFLLNDLLDLSKLEAGKMSLDLAPLNLVDLIHACINEQKLQLQEHRLDCDFVSDESGARCRCDRNRIYQVVANVLSNAIKFSPEGGRIEIGLSAIDNGFRVEVSDQGFGIPADELDQVFDRFYQSERSRNHSGGTGLGLAICREIIELHGGRIWAENNPGGGTRILFELPA